MKLLLIIIFFLFVGFLFIFLLIIKKKSSNNASKPDNSTVDPSVLSSVVTYSLSKKILSDAEYSFYKTLILSAPLDVVIFAKIRISDIISVSGPRNSGNKINQKHFDFCVFDKKSLDIRFVIELDDSSHQSQKVKERDLLVDDVCVQAKLKIVHIPASFAYSVEELKKIFNA
jgi:hypothetical protein